MKKAIGITLFTLLLSGSLSAQKTGNELGDLNPVITGVPSLSIAPDARGGGMGDVGAATSPDVYSQYWNPAKYAFAESDAAFALSYTPWLRKLVSDINLAYLSGYYKIGNDNGDGKIQAISASLRYFSLGQVDLSDIQGNPIGLVKPSEWSLDVAYSRKLSEKWSAAVALRFIYSDLTGGMDPDYTAGIAFAADVAAYYKAPIDVSTGESNFSFGANISNIGTKISYDHGNTSNFIPTDLRLGLSYEYPFDQYNAITLTADVNKLLVPARDSINEDPKTYSQISSISGIFKSFGDPNFAKRLQASVGLEYNYNKQFFVRAGYFYESPYNGNRRYFTVGAGFKLTAFQLDAGYVVATSQSNPLDQTLRFSLAFDLDGIKSLLH